MHWFWRATIAAGVTGVYGGCASFHGPLHFVHKWAFDRIHDLQREHMYTGYSEILIAYALAYAVPHAVVAFAIFALLTRWLGPDPRHDGETHCRHCNHILRGITEPRCPECGESI